MTDNNFLSQYTNTDDILQDMKKIINVSRSNAYQAVNFALVHRNWLLGRRIAEEELKGESRAEYGLEIIKNFQRNFSAAPVNVFIMIINYCYVNLNLFKFR